MADDWWRTDGQCEWLGGTARLRSSATDRWECRNNYVQYRNLIVWDQRGYFQYVDDTILFMEHDMGKTQNLKLILPAFEQVSGLKINFHKSEMFFFSDAQDEATQYAELFGFELGQFPINYLGIPIHYRRPTIAQ